MGDLSRLPNIGKIVEQQLNEVGVETVKQLIEIGSKCVIKDDMTELIEQYIKADLIVWSFPLYYFGMPSKIKAFLDRMLPTNLPYMDINQNGTSGHPSRYDLSHQRHVLISTCGFYTAKNNYDALFSQFEIMSGRGTISCTSA